MSKQIEVDGLSFSLSYSGAVYCAACAREIELEKLMAAMDKAGGDNG